MPLYEYICKTCENRFEKLVKSISVAEKAPCPECGSKKTTRAVSVFAVSAAGSGKTAPAPAPPGMCGRCGGSGPCATVF